MNADLRPPHDASAAGAGAATAPAARKRLVIRTTTPDDLRLVRDLLTLRDGRAWDDASTAWFLFDLDPARCVGWLALVDDAPAGLSTVFRRVLVGPGGPWRAGYWANLFVHPDHRDLMIYPRLAAAMLRAAPDLGLDVLYGGTRQKHVAFGHTRLGFTTVGTVPLLVKPLRPARLFAKYKGWPALGAVAGPLDAAWSVVLAAGRTGVTAHRCITESAPRDVADACVATLRDGAADRVVATWTPESFAYRYRQTREGEGGYHVVRDDDGVGVVWRIAEREPAIRAAVILDAFAPSGREQALRAVVAEVERRALGDGAEIAMFLSGIGPAVHAAFTAAGYRLGPESYDLQLWPRAALDATPSLGDLTRWRFAFGDHDAF